MEDRVGQAEVRPPGAALIALAAILVITAAWWALALWPAGTVEPEWLARTRAACFGSARGGLPDAGGWVLLIGEPLGMLAALSLVFGRALRRELRWLAARRSRRAGALAAFTLLGLGMTGLATRASGLWAAGRQEAESGWTVSRVDREPPSVGLLDQRGRHVSFADFRGRPVILTFAFGHCSTVCPAMVNELRDARRRSGRRDVALLILTLDPWRDTPERLPTLARAWGLEAGDAALSGSVADVERTLDELGVGRQRLEDTGDVDHGGAAMILEEHGRIAWRLDGSSHGVAALFRKL